MKNLFGLNHLIQSEEKTILVTRNTLKGNYEFFPKVIDVLFKLPYFVGKKDDISTERGQLQSFCYTHYVQAPYTFWAIYNLYEKGYYLEGIILFRHLLEAFIQMRYFDKYPDKLNDHIIGNKRVTFKSMFDEFSEGYYHRYYGKQFSGAAHGVLVKDIFRFERTSPSEGRTVLGCEYNEDHATYLSNNVVPIIFGYINLFNKFFPNNILNQDEEIFRNYTTARDWLIKYMGSHKRTYPESIEFFDHTDKYIYY